MNTSTIIQHLRHLMTIEPSKDFSNRSRALILAATQEKTSTSMAGSSHQTIIRLWSLRTVFFVAGSTAIVIGLLYGSRYFSPLFLPGLNQEKIIAEATDINHTISIQLSQLDYFDTASQASNHALSQVSAPSLNHLNTEILSNDTKQIQALAAPFPVGSSQSSTDTTSQAIESILESLQK